MKKLLPLLLLVFSISFSAFASSTDTEISIVPASHPNACVALQLENLSGGSHTWTFNPAVVNAATGLTVSSITTTTGSEPLVYWTTVGDKQVCYDGTCEWFHSCNCNPLAADDYEDAPLVCNTDLYCGTTSSAYGQDHESDIEHEGSIENNSWIEFIAEDSDVTFNISVESGCYIQFAVYEVNTSAGETSYTLMTDIDWTDIDVGFTGNQTINATGLTPGTSYYLHFDGHGGAECDYEIGFVSGVQVLEVNASAAMVCSGDATTLTVTPNDPGATYTWTDNQGGGPYPNSSSIVVNPTVNTVYTVAVSGGSCSISDTYDVAVNIDPSCAPCASPPTVNLSSSSGSTCVNDPITINGNTFGGSATNVTITENGAGSVTPTSSGSSPFGFTYTPAAGDAGGTVTITVTSNNPSGAPCSPDIKTYTLNVTAETTPTFTQVPAICNGDALSALPATSNNGINGSWSPALNNTATTLYTFTPTAGQCASTTTMTITVNSPTTPTFTQVPAICNGDALSALPTTSNNGINGSWSPALNNTVTTLYTFTPTAGQCASTATMTITVNNPTTPTFTQVPAICQGDVLSALPTTSNNGINGSWSPALNNNTTTLYTFTPTAGQCATSTTMTITVNPPSITPTFTQAPAICQGDALSALPTTSNNGINGSWSPALDNMNTTVYTFTPTAGQCATSTTMTITVNSPTTPTFTQVPAICQGNALTALPTTSNNGISGSWSPALNNTTTTLYTFTPTAGQCASTVTMTITVNSLPPAIDQNPTVCEDAGTPGSSIGIDLTALDNSINGGSGASVTWYSDAGLSSLVGTPTNMTVNDNDVFYVLVDNGTCSDTAMVTYTVTSPVSPVDPMPEICEDTAGSGSAANIDLTTYNNSVYAGGGTLTWYQDAGTSILIGDPSDTTITDGMILYADVVDGLCALTTPVTFTINPLPTSNPSSMELCEDAAGSGQASFDLTTLDNTINGGTTDVVTWFTDAGTSSSIGAPGAYVTGNTTVYALVTDGTTSCTDTAAVVLTVNPLPASNPSAMEMCDEGGNQATFDLTTLDNTINGGTADVVTWFTDAATSGSIGTPGAYVTGSTTVYALVTDGTTNCTDTAAVVLTVNPLPTVANTSINMCDDGSGQASFDLTSVDNTVNGGTANVVTWFEDALATTPIGAPGAYVTGNDSVYAVVTDGTTLCMDTTDVYLILDPLPTANDQTPQLCEDASTPGTVAGVDLTLLDGSIDGGAGNTLTWYTDAGLTTPVGTPTNTTVNDNDVFYVLVDNGTCSDTAMVTYTVTSTISLTDPSPVLCEDTFGSGNVTNIDLTSYNTGVYSGAGATYTWYTDAGLITPVGTPTNVTVSNGTIFYVDVVDGTCNNNTTLTFTVNGQSVGTVDSTICNGGSVTINGTVYSSATTLSGVEIFTSANNCDSTVTVNITELPLITGVLDSTVCNGGSFVFNGTTYDAANPTGTEVLTAASGCDSTITVTLTELPLITTQILDNICSGSNYTFPEGTVNNLTADTTHISTLIAASGCDSVVTYVITVNPQLNINPTVTDTVTCIGDPLTLTATGSGNGTITWFSDASGTTIVGTGTMFTPSFGSTGTYTFYVQEVGACSSTLVPITVTVGGVTASIGANPSTGFVPLDVEFTNGSTTGAGITYTWDFGDGTGDNVFEPSHTYTDINNYVATLTVTDAANCSASATVTIEVIGESSILIPNVFTPNNDGNNDVFTVSGTNLEEVNCVIFNRWGQKLYEWDRVKGAWDGRTLSGEECPDGTYFYIVEAKGLDGEQYFKKGGFSLIR